MKRVCVDESADIRIEFPSHTMRLSVELLDSCHCCNHYIMYAEDCNHNIPTDNPDLYASVLTCLNVIVCE